MPPRYVPDLPLPPYAYVPGRFPHPTRDPGGHHFGARLPSPRGFDPARWRDCGAFLAGVDLFNHGYYWEAHEAWETVWHAAGRRGAAGELLRGLIKLAGAGFKVREGRGAGVRRLAAGAAAHFAALAAAAPAGARFMGVEPAALAALAAAAARGEGLRAAPADAPAFAAFDFVLRLE